MEFVLRYKGALPAGRSGNEAKHRIRHVFHEQLVDLCRSEPRFSDALKPDLPEGVLKGRQVEVPRPLQELFFYVRLGGFQFVPLVSRPHELACALRIKFLRREKPGEIFRDGGDLDNRLKTLLDAMRIPHNEEELQGVTAPGEGECCYCLLEDDSLITKITIETHRLLGPLDADEKDTDVHLDIHVEVESTYPMWGNIGF